MKPESPSSFLPVLLRMAVFVLLGTALVAFLWETLNQALAWEAGFLRLAWSIPLTMAFFHLVWELSQRVRHW